MSVKGLLDNTVRPLSTSMTVIDACQAMHDGQVGAVTIADAGRLCGIFTYCDLVERVLLANRRPDETSLSEVMSREVETLRGDSSYGDALRLMVTKNYTYMPVVNESGAFRGMVSLRGLLEHRIGNLADELNSVTQYLAVDGPGGD